MSELEVAEIMALQAEVDAAPAGQVRMFDDGRTIAYRTGKPRGDSGAWLIVSPDGSVRNVSIVHVDEYGPLARWAVLTPDRRS